MQIDIAAFTASAIYSVANDPNNGAIGTVTVGLIMPGAGWKLGVKPVINYVDVCCLTTLASGGAATISWGLRSVTAITAGGTTSIRTKPTILCGATGFGAYNASVDSEGAFQPIQGAISQANPLKIGINNGFLTSWNVIMVIGGAALTAGSCRVDITGYYSSM